MDERGARERPRVRADYGIDAPGVVLNLAIAGTAALVLGIGLSIVLGSTYPVLAEALGNIGFFTGIGFLVTAGLMGLSSKVGKLRERDRILDSIPWRGDETVLDVGCGRGLLLVGAAKRLTTGEAIGVDIWQSVDQSGNRPEATLENARAEGVADRVLVKDGDARRLPFEDGAFDVVVSSLALHNIHDKEERERAIREISRVLKPGGRLIIVDIWNTGEYARVLRGCGMRGVQRSNLHFNIFPAVRAVTARKPGPDE